jgi:hypothetical protein
MFHPKCIFLPSRSLQGERKISKIADYCCGILRLEHGHKHGSRLHRYISPAAQTANAEDIEHTLEELFPQ